MPVGVISDTSHDVKDDCSYYYVPRAACQKVRDKYPAREQFVMCLQFSDYHMN